MRLIVVRHCAKVEGLIGKPAAIAANPPPTMEGMEETHTHLVEQLRQFAPYRACYSSLMARALGTASVLALGLGIETINGRRGLGQHANKDGERVIYYPGCELETFDVWQENALFTLAELHLKHQADDTILLVTHLPVIAGLIAWTHGLAREDQIENIAKSISHNPEFNRDYFVFQWNGTNLKLEPQL